MSGGQRAQGIDAAAEHFDAEVTAGAATLSVVSALTIDEHGAGLLAERRVADAARVADVVSQLLHRDHVAHAAAAAGLLVRTLPVSGKGTTSTSASAEATVGCGAF